MADQTPDSLSNKSEAEAFRKKGKRRERRKLRLHAGRNKPNESEDDSRPHSTRRKNPTCVCNIAPLLTSILQSLLLLLLLNSPFTRSPRGNEREVFFGYLPRSYAHM